MRSDITVVAEPREGRGKNENNRLRMKGLSPAIVYGGDEEPIAVAVDPKEIRKIVLSQAGFNTIFDLQIKDHKTLPVMIIARQLDPIKDSLLHVDMKRIDMAARIVVKVAVHFQGEPRGVKEQGGSHDVVSREAMIECLPDEIPAGFWIDVTELRVGNAVRASDLPLTGSMKLKMNPEAILTHVVAVRGTAAEAAPEAAAAPAKNAPAKNAPAAKNAAPAAKAPAKKK